jgi:hypothetical protein
MSDGNDPMSLKAFHVVFIAVSTILCIGFGIWAILEYRTTRSVGTLLWGIVSLIAAIVLIVYGRWFWAKLKNIGNP